ncbi:flagellar assembly protein A [Paenibacillus sp. FA6]|uniref:flagellar assembly protein A n=1 Tax=Paenibacillus sp. FA6 TaxID=3413029 RepID=UPI003F6597E4
MSNHISEQEIIKLLSKLDQNSHSHEREGKGSSSTMRMFNLDDEIIDGFIKVEHGKIIVGNSSNGGKVPTLNAKAPVKLWIDGKEISKENKVTSESLLEWEIEEKPLFEILVSEDKLDAYLTINRSQRYAWSLEDKTLELSVILTAEEDTSIILETFNLQDILTVVENMNIKMNLDVAVVQMEICQPSHRPVKIARGKPPVRGQDAQLDMFFSENIENIFTEVRGLVDYKNYMNIPSVKSGDVIAKKTPPVEGQTGYDVF